VHGPAGGVEEADLAGVLERAVRDVDGLLEEFLLAEAFLVGRLWDCFALGEEDLGGAADEVAALAG
jgi:hypothetical protein